MLYNLFRLTEFDGIVIYLFLITTLFKMYSSGITKRNTLMYFLTSITAFGILNYATYLLPFAPHPHHYWYNMLVLLAVPLITTNVFLSGHFAGKYLYILFFVTFIQLYKMVWGALYSAEFSIDRNIYIFWDMFSFVLILVLIYAFYKKFKKTIPDVHDSIGKRFLLLTYLPFSIIIYYSLDLMHLTLFNRYRDSILALIIIPAIPIIYDFYVSTIFAYEEQRKLDMALTETKAQVHRYRYSLEIEERIKKERHELKNNYLFIQTLLEQKKYDELNDYLTNSIGEKLDNLSLVSTGNTMIDYIVNRKISEAQKQHIKIYTEITLPNELSVDDENFCTIFLNLFNNAIEACGKVDSPDIHILLKVVSNYLCCEIKNKADMDAILSNPDLVSTKKDRENHGLGLKIVNETINDCDGIFQTSVEGNYFLSKFMLPLR